MENENDKWGCGEGTQKNLKNWDHEKAEDMVVLDAIVTWRVDETLRREV